MQLMSFNKMKLVDKAKLSVIQKVDIIYLFCL